MKIKYIYVLLVYVVHLVLLVHLVHLGMSKAYKAYKAYKKHCRNLVHLGVHLAFNCFFACPPAMPEYLLPGGILVGNAAMCAWSRKSASFWLKFGLNSAPAARQNSVKKVTDNYDNSYYHNHRILNTPKIKNNRICLMINDLINAANVINNFGLYKVIDRINLFWAAEKSDLFLTAGIVRGLEGRTA